MSSIDLKQYIPKYYENNTVMNEHLSSCEKEIEKSNDYMKDILFQTYIDSATSVGLARWEKDLGLPTDTTKTFNKRRQLIKSKLLSFQTITPNVIKTAVDNMIGSGNCTITENYEDYSFEIAFTTFKGIPANIDDIKKVVSDMRPAHLKVNYDYWFNSWQFLKDNFTWGELRAYTWYEASVYE